MLKKLAAILAIGSALLATAPGLAQADPSQSKNLEQRIKQQRRAYRKKLKQRAFNTVLKETAAAMPRFNGTRKEQERIFADIKKDEEYFRKEHQKERKQKIADSEADAKNYYSQTKQFLERNYQTTQTKLFMKGVTDTVNAIIPFSSADRIKSFNSAKTIAAQIEALDKKRKQEELPVTKYEHVLAYNLALAEPTRDKTMASLDEIAGTGWFNFSNKRSVEKSLKIRIKARKQIDHFYIAKRLRYQNVFNRVAQFVNTGLNAATLLEMNSPNAASAAVGFLYNVGMNVLDLKRMTPHENFERYQLQQAIIAYPDSKLVNNAKKRLKELDKKFNENFARSEIKRGQELLAQGKAQLAKFYFEFAAGKDPSNKEAQSFIAKADELLQKKANYRKKKFNVDPLLTDQTAAEQQAQKKLIKQLVSFNFKGAQTASKDMAKNPALGRLKGTFKYVEGLSADTLEQKIALVKEAVNMDNEAALMYYNNFSTNPQLQADLAHAQYLKDSLKFIFLGKDPKKTGLDALAHGTIQTLFKGAAGLKSLGIYEGVNIALRTIMYFSGNPVPRTDYIRQVEIAAQNAPFGSKTKKLLQEQAAELLAKEGKYEQAKKYRNVLGQKEEVSSLESLIKKHKDIKEPEQFGHSKAADMVKIWQATGRKGTSIKREQLKQFKSLLPLLGIPIGEDIDNKSCPRCHQKKLDYDAANKTISCHGSNCGYHAHYELKHDWLNGETNDGELAKDGITLFPTGVLIRYEQGADVGTLSRMLGARKPTYDIQYKWHQIPRNIILKFRDFLEHQSREKRRVQLVKASDNFFLTGGAYATQNAGGLFEAGFGLEIDQRTEVSLSARIDNRSFSLYLSNINTDYNDRRKTLETAIETIYNFDKERYDFRAVVIDQNLYDATIRRMKVYFENGEIVYTPEFAKIFAIKDWAAIAGISNDAEKGGFGGYLKLYKLVNSTKDIHHEALKSNLFEHRRDVIDPRRWDAYFGLIGQAYPDYYSAELRLYMNALLNKPDDDNKVLENFAFNIGYDPEKGYFVGGSFPMSIFIPGVSHDKIPFDVYIGYGTKKNFLFGVSVRETGLPEIYARRFRQF